MTADILRRAADLARKRAKAARVGRWQTVPSVITPNASLVVAEWQSGPQRVATCSGSLPEGNEANAAHIASWHPAAALATADSLDQRADVHDNYDCVHEPCALMALARAHLGDAD